MEAICNSGSVEFLAVLREGSCAALPSESVLHLREEHMLAKPSLLALTQPSTECSVMDKTAMDDLSQLQRNGG